MALAPMTDQASSEKATSTKIIALPSGVALCQMATSSTSELAAAKINRTFIKDRSEKITFSRHRFTRQRARGQNVSAKHTPGFAKGDKPNNESIREKFADFERIFEVRRESR